MGCIKHGGKGPEDCLYADEQFWITNIDSAKQFCEGQQKKKFNLPKVNVSLKNYNYNAKDKNLLVI